MGLDSFIYKKQLISDNYKKRVERLKENKTLPKPERVFRETEVLYLRKANQIHNYFVQNFADGEDNCQKIPIGIEDIKELKSICEEVIKSSKLKEAVIQNGEGFFSENPDDEVEEVRIEKDLSFKKLGKKKYKDLQKGDMFFPKEGFGREAICFVIGKADKEVKSKDDENKLEPTVRLHVENLEKGKKIVDTKKAEELLPAISGFFFGSTEYDKWYLENLEEYIKQADEIIKDYEQDLKNGIDEWDIDYYYQASW